MSGAVVQSKFVTGTAGAGTVAATFAVSVTALNQIAVFVFDPSGTSRTFSVSDNAGNAYAQKSLHTNSTSGSTTATYLATGVPGGGVTVTVNSSSGTDTVAVCVAEVSGCAGLGPAGAANGAPTVQFAANGDQVAPGTAANSITSTAMTTTATSFVLGVAMYSAITGTASIAAGSGYTSTAAGNVVVQGWSGLSLGTNPARLEWQSGVAAGSPAATFTDATNGGTAGNDYITLALALTETQTAQSAGFLSAAASVTTSGFTANQWNTVNAYALGVPVGATGVVLNVNATTGHTASAFGLRPTGSSDTWQQTGQAGVTTATQQYRHVGLNSGGQFDIYPTAAFGAGTALQVVGWWGSEAVFYLNALGPLGTATVASYTPYTPAVPSGTLGVLVGFNKNPSAWCVRQDGSGDDFTTGGFTGNAGFGECIVGLSLSGVFDYKTNASTGVTPYILGYFPAGSGLNWHGTSINRTPGTAGSAQSLTTTSGATRYIYNVGGSINYTVTSGETGLPLFENTYGSGGQCICGSSPTANISTTTGAFVMELGYFAPAAPPPSNVFGLLMGVGT